MSSFGGFDIDSMMQEVSLPKTKPVTQEKKSPDEKGGNNDTKANNSETQTDITGAVAQKPENSEVGESEEPKKHIETKKREKKPKSDVVPVKKSKSDFVQIRDFPRELLAQVRAEFPSAANNTDALAAYTFVKNGRKGSVSDEVQRLADEYDGDKTAESISKRLSAIESSLSKQFISMQELELVVGFLVFDRLGFRENVPKDPSNIDFLENGIADVMKRMQEQAKIYRTQKNIKEGRPFR